MKTTKSKRPLTFPASIDNVECMAAARALCFAREYGLTSIILESDSKTMNKALKSKNNSFTSYSHLVGKVKILVETFCDITFSHTQGNFVVHNIARYARNVSGLSVWMENVLPHLNLITLANFG